MMFSFLPVPCRAPCLSLLMVGLTHAEEFTKDDSTTFLAHFDQSEDSDYSEGQLQVKSPTGATLTINNGGKFREGLSCEAGAAVYDARGSMDLAEGTLEFWVKIDFSDPNNANRILFKLPTREKNDRDNSVVFSILHHQPGDLWLFLGMPENPAITAEARWSSDEWHHIAVTWTMSRVTLYLDGVQVGSTDTQNGLFGEHPVDASGLTGVFSLGDFFDTEQASLSSKAVFDEVRISNKVRYTSDFTP